MPSCWYLHHLHNTCAFQGPPSWWTVDDFTEWTGNTRGSRYTYRRWYQYGLPYPTEKFGMLSTTPHTLPKCSVTSVCMMSIPCRRYRYGLPYPTGHFGMMRSPMPYRTFRYVRYVRYDAPYPTYRTFRSFGMTPIIPVMYRAYIRVRYLTPPPPPPLLIPYNDQNEAW